MLAVLAALAIAQPDSIVRQPDPQEKHFGRLRQLTFGGQNAEAYWSLDGKYLTFQASTPDHAYPDEQIFTMRADGSGKTLMSTGKGRCTCSYFTPNGKWLYFSSTHATEPGGQPPVDMSKGYVWEVNPNYVMYRMPLGGPYGLVEDLGDGSTRRTLGREHLTPIVSKPGAYIAETTIAPNGKYMVWTSDFEGDLDIYRSDLEGKHIMRLTNQVGYDGGPFVSWDSKKIVYRRDSFTNETEIQDYKELLKRHLIRPTKLEIWVMDADGSNKRQVTHLNCASFAPFMCPDNKRIIFASNYGDPKGREFDLFLIDLDGTHLERVTYTKEFDGFPMFTRDGKKLVFCSNRFGTKPHETNIFVADWKE